MAVGQKKMGINDRRYLVRAMTAIAGGVAASGGLCGALIGGLAFLGSVLGRDEPEKKDDPLLWQACRVFYSRFEKVVAGEYNSMNCRDISGVDNWRDREQVRAFYNGDGVIRCANSTGKAAAILCGVIEKYITE